MKQHLNLYLLALSALAFGVAEFPVRAEQPSAPPMTTASGSATNASMEAIQAELRALRAEVTDLRRQVSMLRAMKNPSSTGAAGANPASTMSPVRGSNTLPAQVAIKDLPRHTLGKSDAPVVLVEFTDYECGFCKRFFDETFPRLKKDYIDTGKLRFVSRNMPAVTHSNATGAALTLLTAAERSEADYWQMRDWLFANHRALSPASLDRYTALAGFDRSKIRAGTSGQHGAEIQDDIAAAHAAGLTGTPGFVLGTSDGQMIRGERITGAKTFAFFESRIQAQLNRTTPPVVAPTARP